MNNGIVNIKELNDLIASKSNIVNLVNQGMNQTIVGQKHLIDSLLIALLSNGHILLEGVPGLAKTLAIKTLASIIDAKYNRIQFTPDLLPADVVGTMMYSVQKETFQIKKGPIFANFVLADEINRAPAKVQSALLEAMAERQVSVGGKRYPLSNLFMVMATQHPIEHEGTYNLPEAQLDRFLMYIKIDQPDAAAEKKILELVRREDKNENKEINNAAPHKMTIGEVLAAQQEVLAIHTSEEVEKYLIELIMATRKPEKYNNTLTGMVRYGASPRATIALDKCSKINAWLEGRNFVTPEDIHAVAYDVLRHRIILSFEAQAEELSSDDVISALLKAVPLP